MRHLIPFVLAALVGLAALASEPESSPCRDYVPRPGEQCVYPTQEIDFDGYRVCSCPGSIPCTDTQQVFL